MWFDPTNLGGKILATLGVLAEFALTAFLSTTTVFLAKVSVAGGQTPEQSKETTGATCVLTQRSITTKATVAIQLVVMMLHSSLRSQPTTAVSLTAIPDPTHHNNGTKLSYKSNDRTSLYGR